MPVSVISPSSERTLPYLPNITKHEQKSLT